MRDPISELATVPAIPLHPSIGSTRLSVAAIVANLLAISDRSLEDPWPWRPEDTDDLDVRYAFYRIHERLDEATRAITLGRADGTAARIGPTGPALGDLTEARWDLHGVLAGLPAATWDADPGGGEWTVRQTMGHIVGSQRSYGWYNAWYLRHPMTEAEVVRPPEGSMGVEPTDDEEGMGTPDEVRARLDEVADAVCVANAALGADALTIGARWSGLPVTMGFRFGHYASHVREHTIQVEKTLAPLDRQPTEVERLVRLILATYGRLEAQLIGRSAEDLDTPLTGGTSAAAILASAVADARATADSVHRTAG